LVFPLNHKHPSDYILENSNLYISNLASANSKDRNIPYYQEYQSINWFKAAVKIYVAALLKGHTKQDTCNLPLDFSFKIYKMHRS